LNTIKLSICIPTYNRAKFLPELLESIVKQSHGYDIEVVVSDNASTDNTQEVLKLYIENHNNIKLSVADSNVGPDRNYFRAVSMAKGEYCWLIGSDDVIDDGGLEFVMQSLTSNQDVYLQDRVECDIDMNVLQRRSWWCKQAIMEWDFSKDEINHYFKQCNSLGGVFSFLSSIIVRKSKWDEYIPSEKYYETAYSHVFTLLSILKNDGTLKLLSNSGVLSRGGNDHFLSNGVCKRRLIDFYGYVMLADDLDMDALKFLLQKEHNIKSLSALFTGCVSFDVAVIYSRLAGFSHWKIYIAQALGVIRSKVNK